MRVHLHNLSDIIHSAVLKIYRMITMATMKLIIAQHGNAWNDIWVM
jgi:hypothetical protein